MLVSLLVLLDKVRVVLQTLPDLLEPFLLHKILEALVVEEVVPHEAEEARQEIIRSPPMDHQGGEGVECLVNYFPV